VNFCENPWRGSFIVDELTGLVEEQGYQEFARISERGGVLGAMDTMYQELADTDPLSHKPPSAQLARRRPVEGVQHRPDALDERVVGQFTLAGRAQQVRQLCPVVLSSERLARTQLAPDFASLVRAPHAVQEIGQVMRRGEQLKAVVGPNKRV
jgi:methylmalonyl-CoA mutase N-terminal domain/subunit